MRARPGLTVGAWTGEARWERSGMRTASKSALVSVGCGRASKEFPNSYSSPQGVSSSGCVCRTRSQDAQLARVPGDAADPPRLFAAAGCCLLRLHRCRAAFTVPSERAAAHRAQRWLCPGDTEH